MAAAAPQGGNQGDNWAGPLWTLAAVFLALGVIWYLFRDNIISIFLLIKIYEVNFLIWISNLVYSPGYFDPLRNALMAAHTYPSKVGFNDLYVLGSAVGDYLRYPFVAILVFMAIAVYFFNTARMFRHTYGMLELARLEKNNWPQITPVVNLDLIKIDINKGPWAMAMNPMQFCKRHKLLDEVRPTRKEGMARKDWDRIEVVLRRGAANKIFALQLGPLWSGIDKLPPYIRALFAAFAARMNADTKPALKLLAQLSASSTSSKMNFAGADELIKKHENTKLVQEIIGRHAYVMTVMATMLETAREDGVQASADFLWLKPVDRRLWYILNTVGRQTPFIEVAGIFAHWVAEKEAHRKLLVPMVEEATNAVELALKEVVYRPDDVEA